MRKGEVREGATYGFWWIVISIVILVVIIGLGWIALIADRPMQKYQEESRKQTYDTSRQFQQGINRDIARYCEQMRNAKEPSAKKAIAALMRSNAATYDGPLTPDNQDCLSDAKGF